MLHVTIDAVSCFSESMDKLQGSKKPKFIMTIIITVITQLISKKPKRTE